MGRPAKYKTPKELDKAIGEYFSSLITEEEDAKHPTITGLALYLGFADRSSLYNYEKHEEFSYTIKRAITTIEELYEGQLMNGRGNTAGVIFWLKNIPTIMRG